ncbi:hypothetical protein KBY30_17375 [Ruegeria pomeroyi]|nr:hypothetical protein [Ruegeria pomeroyi]
MANKTLAISAALLTVIAFATPTFANDYRVFPSQEALAAEISSNMAEGSFSNLISSLAPGLQTALGRIQRLEDAFAGQIPTFENNAVLFSSNTRDTVHREVRAWWSDETYVFVGSLTHEQEAGVVVLDFLLTDNVQRASRWFFSGNPD